MKTELMDQIADMYEDEPLMRIDGMDEACIGLVSGFGKQNVFCYDEEKIMKMLMADGISREEAEEHFYFNIAGAYVGEGTPCFLNTFEQED